MRVTAHGVSLMVPVKHTLREGEVVESPVFAFFGIFAGPARPSVWPCNKLRILLGYEVMKVPYLFIGRSVLVLFLSALMGEGLVRLLQYPSNAVEPMYLPQAVVGDPILGWRHRPGVYRYVMPGPAVSETFRVTYEKDGQRVTSEERSAKGVPLRLLGCSFVEGFGLDDVDTFAWKLQERLPQYSVRNYGVGGFGTYQSLLMLRQLPRNDERLLDSIVVYGFAAFHTYRNIPNSLIQRSWRGSGIFPVCDDAGCRMEQGKSMDAAWRHSHALSLFENAMDSLYQITLREKGERVTERLIIDMKHEAAIRKDRFIIAPVTALEGRWRMFFKKQEIEVIECVSPLMKNSEYLLPDGHPNQMWAEVYAKCLADYLRRD